MNYNFAFSLANHLKSRVCIFDTVVWVTGSASSLQ